MVRFALRGGSHGIVAFGLAGEVLKLAPDERRRLIELIVEEVGGTVPVFAGVGAPSTRTAIELARHAEAAGVDCVVVPAPLSGALGEGALLDYFVRIASSVSLPVMIQDAPAYLGVGLGAELVGRIGARAENVRLIKLEAGPVEMSKWIDHLGAEFAIWGGDGGVYLLDCIRIGATGIIPGVDLVDLLVRVYEAEARGESALADEALGHPADARLRDASLDRPLQRLRQARPPPARRDRRPRSPLPRQCARRGVGGSARALSLEPPAERGRCSCRVSGSRRCASPSD